VATKSLKKSLDKVGKTCYNTHINKQGHTMTQKSIPSSTGGTITYTKTGLIHSAGKAYSGKIAAQEAKSKSK
jgi:hypothetical protein